MKWKLHVVPASGKRGDLSHVPTLTKATHYAEDGDYVAVLDENGAVVCDNACYYPTPISRENAEKIVAAMNRPEPARRDEWHGQGARTNW